MATHETFPTFLTVPTRPAEPVDTAVPTAALSVEARRQVSLDADTFRRFVTAVRHQRRPSRLATHAAVTSSPVPDAVMAHRLKSFS